MKSALEIARSNALMISKAGLAFTFAFAAGAIMIASVAAYVEKNPRTVCAIQVDTFDGNRYLPSVADTCAEAWQGFDWKSLPGNWRSAIAVEIAE